MSVNEFWYIYKPTKAESIRFWTGKNYSKDAAKAKIYHSKNELMKDYNGGIPVKYALGAMYARR
jgi:hypothetical protein